MRNTVNILRQLIRESIRQRKFYVLVGPPAIGKSTWVRLNAPDAYVISRDDVIDTVREPLGLKYDDMFRPEHRHHQSAVDKIHRSNVSAAVDSGRDIVVDMTNMGVSSRKNAMRAIQGHEEDYEKIAVVFDPRGREDLVRSRLAKRSKILNDKNIPGHVMDDMFKRFEMPTHEEGFDRVVFVDAFDGSDA